MQRQVDVLERRARAAAGEVAATTEELPRPPTGALRDLFQFIAVSKVEVARGPPEEPEPDDAPEASKSAHRRKLRP